MNMRERCARAVAAVGDAPGMAKVWNSPVGRENSYKFVDAVLTEMENPSEEVMNSCFAFAAAATRDQRLDQMAIGLIAFQDIVRAIRSGK